MIYIFHHFGHGIDLNVPVFQSQHHPGPTSPFNPLAQILKETIPGYLINNLVIILSTPNQNSNEFPVQQPGRSTLLRSPDLSA